MRVDARRAFSLRVFSMLVMTSDVRAADDVDIEVAERALRPRLRVSRPPQ